jgi:hypothetical protein
MHLFRNRNRPRSSFELKVGNCHLLEVTVHLRRRNRNRNRSVGTTTTTTTTTKNNNENIETETIVDNDDWDWYNTNKDEINDELLELLERSIISRMYGIEIEEYYQKFHPTVLPPKNNDINQIGSKNKNNKNKRKAGGKTTTSKKKSNNAKTKKKNYASFGKNNNNNNNDNGDDDGDEKPEKDIYFAFGEMIELAYKKQPIDKDDSYSQTILYKKKSNTDNDNDEIIHDATGPVKNQEGTKTATTITTTKFYDRQKLSSRLLVWISPIANSNDVVSTAPNKLDTIYEYRQEMIPISNLFRKPAEVIENEILSLSSDDE